MKPINFIVVSLLIIGCGQTGSQKTPIDQIEFDASGFVSAYQMPVFTDPDRMQKIKIAFPEVENIFTEFAKKNHYPGYVYGVVVDDSLVLSGSIGLLNISSKQKVTLDSKFHIASMTKSFTAMAILKLRDEGKLSLLDHVSRYVPEMSKSQYLTKDSKPVNIENLLTMTAGFPEDNPWGDRQLQDSDDEFLGFLNQGISYSSVPDLNFEYSNLGYALLGVIINRVSGITYQDYITKHILKPLGMTDTYWEYENVPVNELAQGYRWEDETWKKEPMQHTGAFGAMGGLITSMRDFSKYVVFNLSAWPPRNEPDQGPIKRSSVRELHLPRTTGLVAKAKDADNKPCPMLMGYGYGLGVIRDCNGITQVRHSGGLPGFGSNYRFFPEYGLGIISFGNLTYATGSNANQKALDVIFEKGKIKPRTLPVSDILNERSLQVIELIKTWDKDLGKKILAENFYMDHSREIRMREATKLLDSVGEITEIVPMIPQNQLRGTFVMRGEKGELKVFFSLTPEKTPKVQALRLSKIKKDKDDDS